MLEFKRHLAMMVLLCINRFTGGEDVTEIPFNKVEIVQFRQLPQPLTLEELPYRACCVDLLFRPGVT
jgi:hypothetical protein